MQPAQDTPSEIPAAQEDTIQETLQATDEEVKSFHAGIRASLEGSEKQTPSATAPSVPVPTSPVSTLPSSASQMAKDSVCGLDFMIRFPFCVFDIYPIVESVRCIYFCCQLMFIHHTCWIHFWNTTKNINTYLSVHNPDRLQGCTESDLYVERWAVGCECGDATVGEWN